MQESLGQQARERHTLAHAIRNLHPLNAQMAQEALKLANALKAHNKTQVNGWEVAFTRFLEASGLREGYQSQSQVSIQPANLTPMQPDIPPRLPPCT
ncbi:DNA recombination protein RmuC, partial [Klebsiella pneumoniae]